MKTWIAAKCAETRQAHHGVVRLRKANQPANPAAGPCPCEPPSFNAADRLFTGGFFPQRRAVSLG
jgi:hypothetical protein